MLQINDKAPDFILHDQKDNEVSLGQFRGQDVLIAFFPFAWSPVCTDEMKCFSNDMKDLQALGIKVIGISVDSGWTLKAWAQHLGIDFPLLSDFNKTTCRQYGTLRDEGFSDRAYFLINKHGVVAWKRTMPKPDERLENDILIEAIKNI